jgi:hypothetical protein
MSTPRVEAPPTRRRRFAPSVRVLLLVVVVAAVLIGWQTNRARARRRAVEAIERTGGSVLYDYEKPGPGGSKAGESPTPRWLRENLGDDYFSSVKLAYWRANGGAVPADDDLAQLEALDRLEYLSLDGSPMTDAGLAHLAGLKELRWISLLGAHRPAWPTSRG